MAEISNENVRALVEAVQENDELHEKTQALEKRLQAVVDEYIDLAAENGVTLQESDFSRGNIGAFSSLVVVEDDNPDLKEKAAALEEKLQQIVNDYIETAAEYGLTLTPADFNSKA